MLHERRIFGPGDQSSFAELSGDFNPLHVDAVRARRSLAGGAVVHGIHLLLWALDRWGASQTGAFSLTRLDVEFLKPVTLGAEVSLQLSDERDAGATLTLAVGVGIAANIEFDWRAGFDGYSIELGVPEAVQPEELTVAELPGRTGALQLLLDAARSRRLFPVLSERFSANQIAVLLASSRLVGVECPGLHSMYSEIHLKAAPDIATSTLRFRVENFDKRFRSIEMHVEAPGLSGNVNAFLLPAPQEQPDCRSIRSQVANKSYVGQRALVVGGSRGIGEVLAKVLAMRGAEVLLTYVRGEAEARRIVDDIVAHGGKANSARFDAIDSGSDFPAELTQWRPTQVYYFATPYISSGKRGVFNNEMFLQFCAYYVDGFARLIGGLQKPPLQLAFYPSSVFLDEMPVDMAEYIAAKRAGEALCHLLQKWYPGIRISRPRLPRVATDQTKSLLPSQNVEVLPIVLNMLMNLSLEKA